MSKVTNQIARKIQSLQNSRDYADEVKSVRLTKAIDKLLNKLEQVEIAEQNLESAGAYSRTIDRWWDGFYTSGVIPTIDQTIQLDPKQIAALITMSSRRG